MAGNGGARPGAGRPPGEMNHAVREFASRCRKFLEHPENGVPRFERAAAILLDPIIDCKHDNKGEPIPGTDYLVNASSMVATLELLAGYAYGKPRQQVDIGAGDGLVRFLIEAPAEETTQQWLERHATSRAAAAEVSESEPN